MRSRGSLAGQLESDEVAVGHKLNVQLVVELVVHHSFGQSKPQKNVKSAKNVIHD